MVFARIEELLAAYATGAQAPSIASATTTAVEAASGRVVDAQSRFK